MKEMAVAVMLSVAKFSGIYLFYLIGWLLLVKLLLQRPTRVSPKGHGQP